MFESYENFQFIIKQSADHLISKNYFNTDDVTHYLLCDILQKDEAQSQNETDFIPKLEV